MSSTAYRFGASEHIITIEQNAGGVKNLEEIKRGEIYFADLSPVQGSEQGGVRPVIIIQNDIGNRYSPTVIAGAITSKLTKAKLPTHIELRSGEGGISKDSVVLLEQLRTLDKRRLKARIGKVSDEQMEKINRALLISLGFFS